MTLAAPPPDEALRLSALLDCRVLDTPPEAAFDAITASAARLCGVPIALISLVDDDRQWFKSHHGLALQQTPRRDSFCAHALHQSTVLVVPDASLDERFADNPLVTGEPKIRYYAGAPLVTAQGSVLGTLCVIDREPRQLEPWQLNALGALARHAVSLLELRRAGVQLAPAAPPSAAVWAPTAEPKARLVATALALALVLLVAAGWVVARGLLDLRNSALEATEQRRMLFESSALLGHLQAAEAGQRGYLLSGEEAYLAPYAQALASIPGHLSALDRLNLASGDPGVDLVSLTPLVDAKLAELARGIDLRRRQPEVDAAALVRAGLGKDTTERIRQQLDREGVPIYQRLETEVGLVIASSAQALNWFAAGSALSLTLLLLAFAGLRREVARRQRVALELHRAKADVEQQVRERTREVVQSNEALRERSEYLRHIGDNLPGGVLFRSLLHADGRRQFLYASAGVERLHGVSVAAALEDASQVYRQFAPAERERMRDEERVAIAAGRPFDLEVPLQRVDGQERWVKLVSLPSPQADGSVLWDGLELDITDRHLAESKVTQLVEQLRQHAGELEQRVARRTADLASAKEQAESADRMKSAFLATMSHELRTPLNSIIGFTGVMRQGLAGPLSTEQGKQLGMVYASAQHLLALINDVLDLSKIEAGELRLDSQPFALADSLAKVAGIVEPLARAKGLVLTTVVAPAMGKRIGDARRVEQVLLNLLNNAIKFTTAGTVQLVVSRSLEGVKMQVIDSGIGIKPQDLATLFQPFRQIDDAITRNHEGTGLGLTISRRLAQLMGGNVLAESEWGRGSTFTLLLPPDAQGGA